MVISGILFSARASKGAILEQAMLEQGIKAKKIIFVDDKMENIEDVGAYCKKQEIEFIGTHFLISKHRVFPELNLETEMLRFKRLKEDHLWLLDPDL